MLLFAIGERAMQLLHERFVAAVVGNPPGMDQVEAIGRAYMGYALEFPHYFDFCARFQAHSASADPGSNEAACQVCGDAAITVLVRSIETGKRDGSIRADVGDSMILAVTLWAFTHGMIQLAMAKGGTRPHGCRDPRSGQLCLCADAPYGPSAGECGIRHIMKMELLGAKIAYDRNMKTTVDIPDSVLEEAMGFTKARTKRQAIITALEDFNRRRRMSDLIKHAGSCAGFMSADEVKTLRRKG